MPPQGARGRRAKSLLLCAAGNLDTDAGVDADLLKIARAGPPAVGTPQRGLHQARLQQVEPVEERGYPLVSAEHQRGGRVLVPGGGHVRAAWRVKVMRTVREDQVAADRER